MSGFLGYIVSRGCSLPEDPRFQVAAGWRERAFAALRVLLFAILFVAANLALNYLLAGVQRRIAALEGHLLLAMSSIAVAVLVLIVLMARVSGRAFSAYGYAGHRKALNFWMGVACGIVLLAVQLAIMTALGFLHWQAGTPAPSLLKPAITFAVLYLIVAFAEESLFRGYVLVELSRAISFWAATLVLAVMFGAAHGLKGGGENFAGGFQAFLIALAFAFSFRVTGSLWLAIGCHAGWNYAQSFLFGVPNGSLTFPAHLLHPAVEGPGWITGGALGPEGSVLSFLLPAAVAFLSWQTAGQTDAPTRASQSQRGPTPAG